MTPAFWIDRACDRANADPGTVSRYASYLHQAAFEPWTDNDHRKYLLTSVDLEFTVPPAISRTTLAPMPARPGGSLAAACQQLWRWSWKR